MGKRTEAQRQQYIHDFARTCMGRFRININDYGLKSGDYCAEFCKLFCSQHFESRFNELHEFLREQSDEVLGRLAACGLANDETSFKGARMSDVWKGLFGNSRFNFSSSGRLMLFTLAYLAVVAAIIDNCRSDLKNQTTST